MNENVVNIPFNELKGKSDDEIKIILESLNKEVLINNYLNLFNELKESIALLDKTTDTLTKIINNNKIIKKDIDNILKINK